MYVNCFCSSGSMSSAQNCSSNQIKSNQIKTSTIILGTHVQACKIRQLFACRFRLRWKITTWFHRVPMRDPPKKQLLPSEEMPSSQTHQLSKENKCPQVSALLQNLIPQVYQPRRVKRYCGPLAWHLWLTGYLMAGTCRFLCWACWSRMGFWREKHKSKLRHVKCHLKWSLL